MNADSKINVLLIGGGGREHAIAWKLKQSPRLGTLWITHPQNPGIAELGTPIDVPFDLQRPFRLQRFCEHKDIGLVVIGPEDPLAMGAADALASERTAVFGPGQSGARLEADKAWAKSIMRAAAVPTADFKAFTDPRAARAYVETRETPYVVKASGLAKGKGVVVASTIEESLEAVDRIMVQREYGDAGQEVVIEERLLGTEASVLAFVDGRTIYLLESCRDHKPLGDGDTGPNTGGMGAYCPGGVTDAETIQLIQSEIIVPTIDALRREGIEFRGVLYTGVMLTAAGPRVLEFNVRFGDPECQALMARFDSDLIDAMLATAHGTLEDIDIRWNERVSCCIVLASDGYPARPRTGMPITGLDEAGALDDVEIFHAGTTRNEKGEIIVSGGRVLNVVGTGATLEDARSRAYAACELIRFDGKTLRTDIGAAT